MTNPSLRRTDENLQKRVKALERRARKAKRAEEALKIQNAYLELLFESAPDAILLADKAHRITRINPQFSKMFGYTLEEAIGRTADELIAGKDMREEAAQITRQVGRGETIRMEGIRYRKNDTPVHVDLMAAPVLSGKEQIATYASYRDITRRKRMEAAIRKSEEQYRTLIENIPVGVYRCTPGPHGRFLMANPTFLRMFGFTSEQELKKIRVSDIYMDPSQRKDFSHALLRDKSLLASDRLLKKKDGTPLWAVVSARVAHHLLSARVSHFDCVIVDITEKKLAEQALKESHSTLLTVLDSIDATIYVADLKTYEILFANKCMRNVFGRDLVGEVCWKAFREGSEPCPHCTNSQLVDAEGQPTGVRVWEGENPISGRWYVNYDRAIKWADGRIVRLQVAMDITKIKEAEIALKREKGYLDALHETALEIVSRLEAEEVLHAIVQRAARLVGTPHGYVYLYDQAAGELVLRVGIGAYKDMVGMHLKPEEGGPGRVFQSAETLVIDDYRSWPERSQDRRFDELSAVIGLPLRSDRQVSGVMGVGYFGESRKFDPAEITVLSRFAAIASIALDNALLYSNLKKELEEHKRAEEERQKLETQLHLAQRMHAIGTLAGGIAHDFNNILMGIQGRTSLMLLEAASSHPHFEHLKGIEQYVKNAAALTRQLLGFARGGKYEVRPTDLNELIQRNTYMFGRTKKEIRIHEKYQKAIWPAEVDQSQIEQVLLNLFVNAWQAMPGGGDLYIETQNVVLSEKEAHPHEVKAGRYVRVTVTDTGVGMDEQTRQRIFEPFFTTKEMGRGTGLGLASAYGIIKNHGGIIVVDSEMGAGTSFRLYLPASDRGILKEPGLDGKARRGSEGVLLVDDEEMIRSIVKKMLEGLGYRVWLAANEEEAVEQLKSHRGHIELVILDMIMPGSSGVKVFEEVKRLDPGVKVLLSSGYSLDGEAQKIMDRGCDGFIQKPFTMKGISSKMREVLGDRKPPEPHR